MMPTRSYLKLPCLLIVAATLSTALLQLPAASSADASAPAFSAAASPRSGLLTILKHGSPYLDFNYYDWDDNWGGVTREQFSTEARDAVSFNYTTNLPKSKASFTITGGWRQTAPDTFKFNAVLTPETTAPLTMAQFSFAPAPTFRAAGARIIHANGSVTTKDIPFARGSLGDDITQVILTDTSGGKVVFTFDSATQISTDGQARMVLVKDRMEAGKTYPLAFTLTIPGSAKFYPGPDSVPPSNVGWYEFKGQSPIPATSEWTLSSWLESPAGKHGRITRADDKLIYDGHPIKLWGINITYRACSPDKELADRRADFYAAMGINAVRLHKYADGSTWAGIQSKGSSASLDPAELDKMDYFVAALKKRGIYVKLSPVFMMGIGPDDLASVPYASELAEMKGGRIKPAHGCFYVSTELQDLLLKQVTSLLKHTNPYTGLTYAEDPAIAYVETYNEDDALFGGINGILARSPTMRTRTGAKFASWLKNKYESENAFLAAWGDKALNGSFLSNQKLPRNESWSEGRIYPAGNPWFFDPDNLNTSQASIKQRLLDTMTFLYDLQNEVYARYHAGIRATGYSGEMIASNWQAGRAMSHLYNLHSDYLIGTIDRHNYFGHGDSFSFNNTSMVAVPGGGSLSTSLQQVGDRPYMLSEWIHSTPNEWGVEGPAIIGAYGMGLQGWDVSFPFQNEDDGTFSTVIGRSPFNAVAPNFLGIFPAVSRQVLRGDVTESPVVHVRNVNIPSLATGQVGFDEKVSQEHDVKTFDSDVFPAAALAAVRGVVRFTDKFTPTKKFDLAAYTTKDGDILSATKQLRWHPGADSQDGYIVINTPGTQAVVGFTKGQPLTLGNARVQLDSRYAALYLTARDQTGTLATGKAILISAIARARNAGSIVADDAFLFSRGDAKRGKPIGPVIMEPVVATIQFSRPGAPTVYLLDHNGVKTGKTLPVTNGSVKIDTGRDATPYYLVEFK